MIDDEDEFADEGTDEATDNWASDFDTSDNYPEGTEAESAQAQSAIMEMPGGRELLDHWGTNFDENFAYARSAFENASDNMPDFIESLATPIEREDGSTYIPGDDPKWLKLAADYGRLMAHRDGIETDFQSNAGNRQKRDAGPIRKEAAMPTDRQQLQDRISDLEEKFPPGTPAWKKPKVQKQLASLYEALHPEPIVGGRDELGQRHM